MNPSQCSVILVKNNAASQDNAVALLASVYSEVVVSPNEGDAWELLYAHQKLHRTTLIVYDIDTDDRKLNTPNPPKTKECFEFLRKVVRELKAGAIHDTVPIVCSASDSPRLMIDCLHNGAADFLVKPIHIEQVKALFLNVYRYRISRPQIGTIDPVYRVIQHDLQNPSTDVAADYSVIAAAVDDNNDLVPTFSLKPHSHCSRSRQQVRPQQFLHGVTWNHFKERLKSVYYAENWLAQTIYNYYAPEPALMESPILPLRGGQVTDLQRMICGWEFLPMDLDELDLVQMVCLIFRQVLSHPELVDLDVPDDDLYTFVFDVCNSYHKTNPYHNFRHAVDVLQSMYYFLCKLGVLEPMIDIASPVQEGDNYTTPSPSDSPSPGSHMGAATGAIDDIVELQSLFRPIDVFALLMACLGHDVGHPGVTNMFMIQSCTPLALLYNDRSVLESFHSMAYFHLLRNSCFRKLTQVRDWPKSVYFRKVIVNSILATDMAMHDEFVLRIVQLTKAWRNNELNLDDEAVRDRERLTLCGALIKCADISNCARPFPVAKRWAEILSEEFALQGDLEKELGLVSLPINERGKVSLEQFQLGFKRNVALKLYQATAELLPAMKFCVDIINTNVLIWEDRIARFNHDSGVAEQDPRDDDDDDVQHYRKENDNSSDHVDAWDVMGKQAVEIAPYNIASSESSQDDESLLLDTLNYSPKPPPTEIDISVPQQWSTDRHQHHQECQCSIQ